MIVDSLTRLLPGLFMMIVLWPYYALFYRIQIECPKPFYIAFFVPCFVRQILREKLWIPDKKYYVHPWTHLMFLKLFLKNFQSVLLVNCLLKCSFKNFLKYSLWMFMQWSLKCSLKYTSYCSFLEVILQRLCKVLLKVHSCGTF